MKKRKYFLIILVLFIIFGFVENNKKQYFSIDGIKYAVSVDGASQNSFPNKGSFNVTVGCSNAAARWNYEEWVAEIYDITGDVNCSISFVSSPKKNFNDYVIELLGTNNSVLSSFYNDGSTLEKITDNGEVDYRYRGKDPNNYIKFNNELWRIIGIFDQKTHGITNKNLVKIIRNDSIGVYSFDNYGEYGVNNYPDSDIYQVLNTAYYNHIDGTGQTYCYRDELKMKCDFTRIGIQDEYQSMVESGVNWYLGAVYSPAGTTATSNLAITSQQAYLKERGTSRYSGNDSTTTSAGLTTPIGLMYVSDYGYAAPSTCTSTLSDYNDLGCADSNWLKANRWEALLAHDLYNTQGGIWRIYLNGSISNGYANYTLDIRPTLYLKSNVYYLSGTGTQVDPYVVAID